MKEQRMKELLFAILDCGYVDLHNLDNCSYSFYDLLEDIKESGEPLNINTITSAMFIRALNDVQKAIDKKLEDNEELSKNIFKEFKLKDVYIFDDVEIYTNYADSCCEINVEVQELYLKYFNEEVALFELLTGFPLV